MTIELPGPWPAEDEGEPPDEAAAPSPIGAASLALLLLLVVASALWHSWGA